MKPQLLETFAGGVTSLIVAVIDGPYDSNALSGIFQRPPVNLGGDGRCLNLNSGCDHGTFIMGLLGARRSAPIPGLCPNCRLVHVPLFVDQNLPSASVGELATAIRVAISAGARLVNLSLAILGDDLQHDAMLAEALDYAGARGAVVMAAAGNQGRLAASQLLSHTVTIPVVAVDSSRRLLPECNFGPAVSQRGVAALGQVLGYAPRGRTIAMSGTSVATAVATGAVARAWSACPNANGDQIRAAVAGLSRGGPTPPILDDKTLLRALGQANVIKCAGSRPHGGRWAKYASLQGEPTIMTTSSRSTDPIGRPASVAIASQSPEGCGCGAIGGECRCESGNPTPSRFIYALGTVDIRFPNQSISEELETAAAGIPAQRHDESLRQYYHRVLSRKTADGRLLVRYVARQVCWILKIEGHIAYNLSLRDWDDLPDLIDCLRRPEPGDHRQPEDDLADYPHDKGRRRSKADQQAHPQIEANKKDPSGNKELPERQHMDLDLFIGSSTMISIEACPGVAAPVLTVDQLCSLKRTDILEWCKTASSTTAPSPEKLFSLLVQSADNLGDTDEFRALNCIAVRYKPIYEKYAELSETCDLDSVKVLPSRLWHERRIVDPVFAFKNRVTGVVQKFFVRVDVSYLFPMIVTQLSEYFDR